MIVPTDPDSSAAGKTASAARVWVGERRAAKMMKVPIASLNPHRDRNLERRASPRLLRVWRHFSGAVALDVQRRREARSAGSTFGVWRGATLRSDLPRILYMRGWALPLRSDLGDRTVLGNRAKIFFIGKRILTFIVDF
jgi:hypothetical protein